MSNIENQTNFLFVKTNPSNKKTLLVENAEKKLVFNKCSTKRTELM